MTTTVRSKIAHGDAVAAEKIQAKIGRNYKDKIPLYSFNQSLIEGIVRKLILAMIEIDWKPEDSAATMRSELLQ